METLIGIIGAICGGIVGWKYVGPWLDEVTEGKRCKCKER